MLKKSLEKPTNCVRVDVCNTKDIQKRFLQVTKMRIVFLKKDLEGKWGDGAKLISVKIHELSVIDIGLFTG